MFSKPTVVVSRCLGFAACRWNGVSIPDDVVESLKPYVEFITTCPEADIGLGVPRDPIRIVSENGKACLFQPSTGRDITKEMQAFVNELLDGIKEADGFILKFRSPSCGLKGVKLYSSKKEKASALATTSGFFGGEVSRRFPFMAVEDEGRLRNFGIREHFLTKLFTLAKFREISKKRSMKELVNFHAANKLLLMAYSEACLRVMGKIVANHEKFDIGLVLENYQAQLLKAFLKPAKPSACVNVIQHALGYSSKGLSKKEKELFLDTLQKFRAKKVPLSVPVGILKSYIVRFDEKYLAGQTFFEPYPEALMEITDSGKGRDMN